MEKHLTPPGRWIASKRSGEHTDPPARHVRSRVKTSGRTVGVDAPVGSAGFSGPQGIPSGISQDKGIKPVKTGSHTKPPQRHISPKLDRRAKITRSTPEHTSTRVI